MEQNMMAAGKTTRDMDLGIFSGQMETNT